MLRDGFFKTIRRIMIKICTKCEIEYPPTLEYFYKDNTHSDGLRSECKICVLKRVQKYQRTHKKQIACYSRKYYKKYYATIKGLLRKKYADIIKRCTNPNFKQYKDYGGRGIKCLFTSDEFVDYVINELKIDPRGLAIDRIDNDGHYKRGNIQFITCSENNKNKRK